MGLPSARSAFGLNAAEWAAVGIGLAAATLPALIPLMVGVLARQFGIGTEQAGYVIAVNMGSILAGSLSCALLARRATSGKLIVSGLCVMVVGNGLTILTSSLAELIASRLVSGLGEGVVGACCYALMGRSRLPGRSIALYAGGQSIVGAVGYALLPSLMAAYGWHVFYILVSLVAVPALLMTATAVRGHEEATEISAKQDALPRPPTASGFCALTAIFLFFVGIAMVWAFMERLGVRQHLSVTQLSVALSASSIAGLCGSLVASLLADRLRFAIGLVIGIVLIAASLGSLLMGGCYFYIAAICGLFFAWTWQFPILFGCLASTDNDGRIAMMTPVATGGALAAGPAIGGFVLEHVGLGMLCTACLGLTIIGTLLAAGVRRRDGGAPIANDLFDEALI